MKKEDLMIGDWVLANENSQSDYEFDYEKYEYCKINNGDDIDFAEEKNYSKTDSVYKPIQLTKDILLINKFKKLFEDKYIFSLPCGTIEVLFFNETVFKLSIINENGNLILKNIIYVHQLQHALKLMGIDKDIVL